MTAPRHPKVTVKCEILHEFIPKGYDPIVPMKSTRGAAGYDVRSAEDGVIPARGNRVFRTGVKVQPPEGWCLIGIPRSGMGAKGVTFANCVGLIDSDYGGELHVLLANHTDEPYAVHAGERIAQVLMMPAYPIDFELVGQGTIQGRGGLGSTGR